MCDGHVRHVGHQAILACCERMDGDAGGMPAAARTSFRLASRASAGGTLHRPRGAAGLALGVEPRGSSRDAAGGTEGPWRRERT